MPQPIDTIAADPCAAISGGSLTIHNCHQFGMTKSEFLIAWAVCNMAGGGGITQAAADARYLRIDGNQANSGAVQTQGLSNLGLTFKANGDAITVDPDIQADTEIPLQETTP